MDVELLQILKKFSTDGCYVRWTKVRLALGYDSFLFIVSTDVILHLEATSHAQSLC